MWAVGVCFHVTLFEGRGLGAYVVGVGDGPSGL